MAEKKALEGAAFVSPVRCYKVDRKKIVVEDFDIEVIWRTMHEFYHDKKYPTLESLLDVVRRKVSLMGNV